MRLALALAFLLLTGCASPVELRDASVDRPNADRPNIPDSPFIIPSFDVPAVVERDAVEFDAFAMDAPNRDVPNAATDVPNWDSPTVDTPLLCAMEALNCGRQCCVGGVSCTLEGNCQRCVPGANALCERPDHALVCVDIGSNPRHCGGCGIVCAPNATCRRGYCEL